MRYNTDFLNSLLLSPCLASIVPWSLEDIVLVNDSLSVLYPCFASFGDF